MRVSILQSNYIPWKGWFNLVALSDVTVIYDSVQYTKNDWRNRNRLPGPGGLVWLSIPVRTAGLLHQPINETRISDRSWARRHWATVRQLLGKRPHFGDHAAEWESWYLDSAADELLHDVNMRFIRGIMGQTGIRTRLVDDREFLLQEDDPTGRVVQICTALGATSYLTGPAGLNYLDASRFERAAVALEVIDYGTYRTYPQAAAPFEHGVSILDVLASLGPRTGGELNAGVHLR